MGAQAAECAADQGAFWPYHDRLFSAAMTSGANGFTMEKLLDYSRELGLDDEQLSLCMVSREKAQVIEDSLAEGFAIPLNSTPTILINGKKMDDPFDYQAFVVEIDRLLSATN